jgi:hypothetical protein
MKKYLFGLFLLSTVLRSGGEWKKRKAQRQKARKGWFKNPVGASDLKNVCDTRAQASFFHQLFFRSNFLERQRF